MKHPLQQNKGASSGHKTKQAALTALLACLICFVPSTITCFYFMFLKQPLTVLNRQTRQAVCANRQSIFNMMPMGGSVFANNLWPNLIGKIGLF